MPSRRSNLRDRASPGPVREGSLHPKQGQDAGSGFHRTQLQRGPHLRFAGKYDEALGALKQLLASSTHPDGKYTDPEKSNRYLFLDRLGVINREQNKTAEAVGYYKQMTELGGEFALRGYQGEIDALREAHQRKEATAGRSGCRQSPPQGSRRSADVCRPACRHGQGRRGNRSRKSAALERHLKIKDTYLALAQIYIRLKQFSDAGDNLNKAEALVTKPEDRLNIDFLRGTMYDREKQYEQAEASSARSSRPIRKTRPS